ncbi:MAG: hypothetical protein WBC05_02395 [Sedimentisphaerales bacterium]
MPGRRLAPLVLDSWSIETTRDFGEIVYLMQVDSAQPTDSTNVFNEVYDFKTVFKNQFES